MIEAEHIVTLARGWLRTPYCHQASLKNVGCDCLGLVRGLWREIYGDEPEQAPPYSADWAEASRDESLAHAAGRHMRRIDIQHWQAGDVVLFRWQPHLPAKHAGIVSSVSSMIHAQDGACVSEVPLSRWWRSRLCFAFRFPGVSD